jgi:hypothetical protein
VSPAFHLRLLADPHHPRDLAAMIHKSSSPPATQQ